MEISELKIEQVENWISFLKLRKKTAESKKNSELQLAFRRDMKPDERAIQSFDNEIKCCIELTDLAYIVKRYLQKAERQEEKQHEKEYSGTRDLQDTDSECTFAI